VIIQISEVCKLSDVSSDIFLIQMSTLISNNMQDMFCLTLRSQSDSSAFLHTVGLLKYVLNCEQCFSNFGLDYLTLGWTLTRFVRFYCIVCEFTFLILHSLQVMNCCWAQLWLELHTSNSTEVCFLTFGTPAIEIQCTRVLLKGEEFMNNLETGIIQASGVIRRLWEKFRL
jgi:hypothetical protein